MRKNLFLLVAVGILVLSAGSSLACSDCAPTEESLEREAITEALRKDLKDNLGIDTVFVFNWLRVKDGWAWVETDPQSSDGQNRYEPFLALLEKREEIWAIAEIPSLEEDAPPVDDAYFRELIERFPGLPREVFPWDKK